MRLAVFDTHGFDREALERANARHGHTLTFFEPRLTDQTAALARGYEAVCVFVNDRLDAPTLDTLAGMGVRLVALRSAGFNNVDLVSAERLGIAVVRVPVYSPHAVAEHALALVLALNRKLLRAALRVREWNFSLEGLVGMDLCGKTAGVVGSGRIGRIMAGLLRGLGCEVLLFDLFPDHAFAEKNGMRYVTLNELLAASSVVSLHVPLTPQTYHLIDARALARMKRGALLVNTGRGALVDSRALVDALKSAHLGGAGLDVYEEEEGVFFEDLSNRVLQDDVLARLLTFPNVLVTSHQAFLTREALDNIAETTLSNLDAFARGELRNAVRAQTALEPPGPPSPLSAPSPAASPSSRRPSRRSGAVRHTRRRRGRG